LSKLGIDTHRIHYISVTNYRSHSALYFRVDGLGNLQSESGAWQVLGVRLILLALEMWGLN